MLNKNNFMKLSRRFMNFFLLPMIIFSSFIIATYSYSVINARAILISPRLGAPICTSPTDGTWQNTKLSENIHIIVGIEPNEVLVPNQWMEKTNWDVRISHSALDCADLIELDVISIKKINNPFSSFGIEDSSILTLNAIDIELSIPKQIDPCLYDLFIGFKTDLSSISLLKTSVGSYFSVKGTGSIIPKPFVISEPNAIYVPFIDDAKPSDAASSDPFSIIHITDVHTALNSENIRTNYDKMNNLAQAISIWAPDVIIETGDITNAPDHYPLEYFYAYNYFLALGLPLIIDNGNHDQGNLGLWKQYFGPLFSNIEWMGARFIQINTASMLNGKIISWVSSILKNRPANQPVFLNCHIPLIDVLGRQNQGYSAVLMESMIKFGGTAVLQGHNHYDMVMDADIALPIFKDLIKSINVATGSEIYTDACHIPARVGNSAPSGIGTKLIITTSGAKDERGYKLRTEGIWSDYEGYLGYRRITLANNQMVNYTYDLDGDGIRDPSYSTPLWNLNGSYEFDSLNPNFGCNFTIASNLTEPIESGRVTFLLPKQTGKTWQPTVAMGTEGIDYIKRYSVSNATHVFFEYRIRIPERLDPNNPSIVKFKMELV